MSSFSAPVGLFLSENQGTFGETSIDDSLNLIFSCKQQGAVWRIGLLKLNYFHQEQRQRCSPI